MNKSEYDPNLTTEDKITTLAIDGMQKPIKVESGGLRCSICGREIFPAEMFCLQCYYSDKRDKPSVRYRPPKPDDPGNLFESLETPAGSEDEAF